MLGAAANLQDTTELATRNVSRWRPIVAAALAATSVLVGVGTLAPAGATPNPVVEGWGLNTYGQVGNGTDISPTTPVTVTLPVGVTPTAIAAGGYHSLAIGSNGNLYAWGQNGYGQLGNGTTTDSWTPVEVSLPGGVQPKAIAAGLADSIALGSNGNVYSWGDNSFEELGNGSTASDSTTPVKVALPAGVTATAISAGQYHSMAIGSDGKLYAWGYNVDGQLGNNSKTTPTKPVVVSMPTGVSATEIAAGGFHSLALGTNGKLYSWGYNAYGQLGDGTTSDHVIPAAITSLVVTITGISAGLYHSVAMTASGLVYTWGYNGYGQLGDGTLVNATSPKKLTLSWSATAVSAGLYHTMALASNGVMYAWGQNGYGQVGNGTTNNAKSPVAVSFSAGTTVTAIPSDSSSSHSLAIAIPAPATTATTLSPSAPAPTYGQAETLTATVTGSDGGGTVAFHDGVNTLSGCGAVALVASGSSYQAQCTTSSLSAGGHSLSAIYSGDSNANSSTSGGLALTVAQAPLTITASSSAVTYGTAAPAVTASYSGFVNGDSVASLTTQPTCSTTDTASSAAGSYPTSCSGASAANYAITYANGMVVVDPAPLSISASSGTMTYGASPPPITPSYVGFVNGDGAGSLSPPPGCSTVATSSSPVGTYASSCSGAADPNYDISYSAGQVVVGAAPLVITASSVSSTYGTAPTAITPSYAGFVNGDDTTSLTTQPSCSTGDQAASPVGTYTTSCSGASDPNYDISYVDGTATVTPAPLTITASSGSMTYGGSVPAVTPTVSGLQNGEGASVLGAGLSCTTTAASTSSVGTYATTCSGASDANYDITYVDGSVTVNAAALTITASSGSMTYGGSVPVISPTITGLQNGDDASALGAGFQCSTLAAPTSPVGSYDSSCSGASDANYDITYVDGSVTVTAAPITITASSGSMTYGGTVPTITADIAGLQNGDTAVALGGGFLCTTAAVSSSPVGSYASTCSGAMDANYDITEIDGTVTVTPAPLTVTASSAPDTYGNAPPAITASYTGFVNGDDDSSLTTPATCTTPATASSPVGTYATSCSGAVDPNYDITYVNGAVVVGQAVLIVVASPGSMTYGGTAPSITPSYLGFVNGDTAASLTTQATCSTPATSSSPVGSYASTCSGAADGNYTISYVDGSVTVAPAPLTITASSGSISYGGASPAISPIYSGFVNGDEPASLGTAATCTSAVTATTPVGSYASTCSGASDANYDISYVDGSVSVTPASITITASSGSMTYGGTPPAITATVTGLQNGEDVSVLGGSLSCSAAVSATSAVGSYPSSCSGASDANYDIGYVDGTVSVTPAAITLTASSGSMTYGGTRPTITATVTGLQNGEGVSVLGALSCSTVATSTSDVGSYPSTCGGASDPNYTPTYEPGAVQVVAAPLMVAASSGSMTYGGTAPTIAPSYSGFVNGDGPGALNTPPTCSTAATSNSPVGTYPSTCGGASDPDYAITYVPGSVVVGTATLVITASSGIKTYGGAAPTITPSYSGFVNGDGPGSLSTGPTCSTSATATSPVGTYASGCSGAVDANYTITYVAGSVSVSPAPLTISASSGTMTYGASAPAITAHVSGLVNGQTAAVLGAGLACTAAAGPTSAVGSYASTCSGASDANYTISYVSGTVNVVPATLTVTANNQSTTFGSPVPALTATITGFVNGQTLATSGVTGQAACTTTATPTSPSGSYPITCTPGTLHAVNYAFTFVAGTLTVSSTTTLPCLTIGSVTVSAGQSVRIAPGCTVIGSITVKAGGYLDSEGAVILGSLSSQTAGALRLCSTSLALFLTATGSTSPVVIGDGTTSCGGSTLIGAVSLTSNTGGVSLQRAGALGVIVVQKNSGGVTVVNNTVLGALTVTQNTGTVLDRPNTVLGVSQLQ